MQARLPVAKGGQRVSAGAGIGFRAAQSTGKAAIGADEEAYTRRAGGCTTHPHNGYQRAPLAASQRRRDLLKHGISLPRSLPRKGRMRRTAVDVLALPYV